MVPGQQKVIGVVRDSFYPTKNPDSQTALLNALLLLESSDADQRVSVLNMQSP